MPTLELNTKQLRQLTKLVFTGNYVQNAFEISDEHKELEEIEQKVFSLLYDTEKGTDIEFDEEFFYPTEEFEHECISCIREYDENSFWKELMDRLVEKDMSELDQKFETIGEMYKKRAEILTFYENEFENFGIDNLTISKKK
jgi:hypothetical protein